MKSPALPPNHPGLSAENPARAVSSANPQAPLSISKNREQWLDVAKGLAILLVVGGHVLIGFLTAQMYPRLTESLNYIIYTIYSFHMPLFFAISGYLNERQQGRATSAQYKDAALKKVIRLGIPFVLFSWIQGLFHLALNRYTNHHFDPIEMITMLGSPFDQFWFLYALLAIFLLLPRLEIATHSDKLVFGILLILKLLPSVFNFTNPVPFIEWFMAYGLYFYGGALVARHFSRNLTQSRLLMLGALAYIPFNLMFYNPATQAAVQGYLTPVGPTAASVLLAFSGISLTVFLVQKVLMPIRWSNAIFNWLGLFSFEIYLLHTIPSAAVRIVLQKFLHTDNLALHLTLAVVAGILIPVLIAQWARFNKGIDFMFYPGKYLKLSKRAKVQAN